MSIKLSCIWCWAFLCIFLYNLRAQANFLSIRSENYRSYAITEAYKNNILDVPLIMHEAHSKNMKSYFFTPIKVDSNPKLNWKLEVIFDTDRKKKPRTILTNLSAIRHKTGSHLLNLAVMRGTKYLDRRQQLSIPTIIEAHQSDNEYIILFSRFPETPGGVRIVTVSHHFRRFYMEYGL